LYVPMWHHDVLARPLWVKIRNMCFALAIQSNI